MTNSKAIIDKVKKTKKKYVKRKFPRKGVDWSKKREGARTEVSAPLFDMRGEDVNIS